MSTSSLRDAEAQHLLHNDPDDGYEMTSVNGEPSTLGESSPPASPKGKHDESREDSISQEEGLLMGVDDAGTATIDPVYEAKARVLNHAVRTPGSRDDHADILQIQEIGMGWYQWQLFVVVGFGWANDNLWPIVTSLICPSSSFCP